MKRHRLLVAAMGNWSDLNPPIMHKGTDFCVRFGLAGGSRALLAMASIFTFSMTQITEVHDFEAENGAICQKCTI